MNTPSGAWLFKCVVHYWYDLTIIYEERSESITVTNLFKAIHITELLVSFFNSNDSRKRVHLYDRPQHNKEGKNSLLDESLHCQKSTKLLCYLGYNMKPQVSTTCHNCRLANKRMHCRSLSAKELYSLPLATVSPTAITLQTCFCREIDKRRTGTRPLYGANLLNSGVQGYRHPHVNAFNIDPTHIFKAT